MAGFTVDVWLYGPLARYGGKANRGSYANLTVELGEGSALSDLLAQLALPSEERGITFVNGLLTAMPGVQPDLSHPLQPGDRVALFHLDSMWPFQYRDGAAMWPGLAKAIGQKNAPFHDTRRTDPKEVLSNAQAPAAEP